MAKTKILIIDGQVLQTEARHRGMGRYSLCLIVALLEQRRYDRTELILTKDLHFSPRDEEDLKGLLPGVTFHYLRLKTTVRNSIDDAIHHNREMVNRYIAGESKTAEVDYFIPSPFQEPVVSVFPDGVKKLLLFYDLIPYLYHHRYEPVMQYENYLKRFRFVFEADCLFTISQSVADDLHTYLGIPNKRLVRIDGAPIRTERITSSPSFDVPDHFVLMPTSDDPRKNNLRAVLGFEEFCAMNPGADYKLILTSKIHKREREHLKLFSKNLIFTGSLPEAELNWLYEKCDTVLFTPESEGLGLPVLEAVEANKKVVCSSLGVFKEISEDAFYYCDHEDQRSIADALSEALNDNEPLPAKEYRRILAYYSWPATARRFIEGEAAIDYARGAEKKPKIAIFTPVPEGLSAIGKVVAESHAVLSEYFDIDYYAERGLYGKAVRPNFLQYVANSYVYAEAFGVDKYCEYDAVIYHIGNGDYHLESIKNGLYLPGYTIIHDTNLKEAYRVLKDKGMIHESRVELEELLNKTVTDKTSSYLTSLLSNQLGILTHSGFAKNAAQSIVLETTPVEVVNLASSVATLPNYKDHDNLVIGLAGIIADVKGIEVIELIADNPAFKDCIIKLFGFSHATQETIDRLNAYENVSVSTNLTDFDFQASIGKLDVFVNYRMEYKGETSLSTIEAMRQGVVVIVKDVGWYGELPDGVVVKVKSTDEVLEKLKTLSENPELLKTIGGRAKRYIQNEFSHEQYAQGLLHLIQSADSTNLKVAQQLKRKHIKTANQYLEYIRKRR